MKPLLISLARAVVLLTAAVNDSEHAFLCCIEEQQHVTFFSMNVMMMLMMAKMMMIIIVMYFCVTEATNKVLGDLLCLAGAVLYGVSNVFQEYLVCRFGSLQYLAAIGLFGSIVSGIQL